MVRVLTLIAGTLALCSCSDDGVALDTANLSAEERVCLTSANYMIDIAREAAEDTNSRPERRETRRVLMEGWVARLQAGEDPCAVYEDIGASTNTF